VFFKKLSSTKGTDRKTHSFKISKNPFNPAKVLKSPKKLIVSNINFHLLPMSGLNGVGNINGLRPMK
jgi:hypothetical protein